MKRFYLLIMLCAANIAAFAQTTVSRTSMVYAGTSSFQDSMWTFNSSDFSVIRRQAPWVVGHTVTGINSITTDPTTGVNYVILKETGVSNRVLATINMQTGACTEIGNLGDKFATLAFNANGTLFGVTGNGATVPETMYQIDKATATKTLFRPLGAGADGEIIAYCADDAKFYHWSGNGTVVWERFDTTGTDVIESLTYTGTPGGETFGALYIGGGQFLTSNIASQFKHWDTAGVISAALSSNPDDIRGVISLSYTSSVSTSGSLVICAGDSTTFAVTGGTGNYQWYKDGVEIPGASNDTYVATMTGVYNAVYTDSNWVTDSVPAGIALIVNPTPNVYNMTGGGSYCADGNGVLTGLDSSNAGIRYQLYYGVTALGSPVDGIDSAISFGLDTAAGTYTVVATDTTTGCMSNMNGVDTITIIPVTVTSVGISRSTSDTICAGTHTTFMAYPVNGGTDPIFIWKVNGAVAGTDSNAYDYVPTDGNHVSVTMVSNAVCPAPDSAVSDTLVMAVFPVGTPLVHLTTTPGDTVCQGTSVTINASPTFGGYGPTFTWVKNTVVVGGSGSSYSFTPIDGDDIYCIMTSDYMCRLSTVAYSNVINMNVEAPIVPSVIITGSPGMIVGIGKPDTLVATVTAGGTNPTYQWLLNGVIVPGATSSVFIRSSFTNNDSVSCLVTRTDACQLSTINSVVLKVANVGVPVAGYVHGAFSLVPNPNKGSFSIKGNTGLNADEAVTADVINMLGQKVYTSTFMTQNGNVDEQLQLGNILTSGMYLLNLHASNGNTLFHFVVE